MTIEENIRKEPLYILCVENPTEEQIDLAIQESDLDLLHLFLTDSRYDKYCNRKDELMFIKDLNGLSDTKLKEILFKDYTLISKVDNPSEKVQIFAINRNPKAILHINSATLKVWKEALKKQPDLIDFYYEPPEELQLTAVRSDPFAIKFIDNPTKKVQSYAIRVKMESIPLIKNIDPDIACECIDRYGLGSFIYLRRTDEKVLNFIRDKLKNM